MRYTAWILGILLALGGLAACGAESAPNIGADAAEDASPAPSDNANTTTSSAIAANPTVAPLAPTVTSDATLAPTITLAPTRTPFPTSENADGPNPLAPTFTAAPATQTATSQPPLVPLEIDYFITNSNLVGESITLFWRVIGSQQVRIYRLNDDDRRTEVWDVEPEGRLSVSLDPERDEGQALARFLLEAEASGNRAEEFLIVETACEQSWFFTPSPGSCPAEPPRFSQQAEQRFEGGLMLWLATEGDIYVLYTDGGNPAWQSVPDRFAEGQPERDDSLSPPAERQQPQRGFGLVWREQPGVRDRLGWALEGEVSYDGIIQSAADPAGQQYLRDRAGGIIVLGANSNRWELLPLTDAQIIDPSLSTPAATD